MSDNHPDKIRISNNQSLRVVINDVNRLAQEIVLLKTEIQNLEQQISEKNTQIHTLTEQINSLITQIETLNNTITSLNTRITELTNTINTQAGVIESLNAQITQMQNTINSLNTLLTSMNTQIDEINGETVINPLPYLAQTKSLLLTALQDKGASLTINSPFRDYVSAVENISPTPQGDPHTTLLLHLDRTYGFNDASIYNRPIEKYFTGTEPFINENNNGKFQNACLELDGTNCIYINQTDFFPFAHAGWTIEFFFYPKSWTYNSYYAFISNYYSFNVSSTTVNRYMRIARGYNYNTESLQIDFYRPKSSGIVNEIAYGSSMNTNAWHHFAICKNPTDPSFKIRVYIDGVFPYWRGTYMNMDNDYYLPWESVPSQLFFFGMARSTTPNNFCPCWVNEIRISDVCRYTEDFTPPTEPFTI